MPSAARATISLVVGLVLLSGCSALGLGRPATPEQSVLEACASFDNKKLVAAGKTLEKTASGNIKPKAASKAFDAFTTVFEAGIEKVENPTVKTRAQLTSIAMRNFAAELRTFEPNQTHVSHLKDKYQELKRQFDKLDKLCTWDW